jgi:hypothetical protein
MDMYDVRQPMFEGGQRIIGYGLLGGSRATNSHDRPDQLGVSRAVTRTSFFLLEQGFVTLTTDPSLNGVAGTFAGNLCMKQNKNRGYQDDEVFRHSLQKGTVNDSLQEFTQ